MVLIWKGFNCKPHKLSCSYRLCFQWLFQERHHQSPGHQHHLYYSLSLCGPLQCTLALQASPDPCGTTEATEGQCELTFCSVGQQFILKISRNLSNKRQIIIVQLSLWNKTALSLGSWVKTVKTDDVASVDVDKIPYIEISVKIPSCYVSLLERGGPECPTLYALRFLYLKHMRGKV